ncbi:MAG TPA: bifunctional demethylmenaquinone methyltransferase/2-methoxy-6-polyprenyl-1,4-benzoquinol methylase UbiE [Bacteroidia bacterium]|nr:bifunctional demethylmenaquinone methyltransferase/2-methoxy-6-polyprenyl-1,4-benzoquinol methylase UbiE [Bacteroidia bacterium]
MKHDSVTPYHSTESKNSQVAGMFDRIAGRYDFLNSLLSAGIHKGWRRKCVELLREDKPKHILDVATGTGDFAIACMSLQPAQVTGIDISEGMMQVGREKIKRLHLDQQISLEFGNAEDLKFPDQHFDAIVVGFGVRNFQNLTLGLQQLYRVLKPGGKLVVLEFSYPVNPLVKGLYNFYFSYITPFIGRFFSKDRRAYSYLTESVKAFPHNQDFVNVLKTCGFTQASYRSLSLGVAAIYQAVK